MARTSLFGVTFLQVRTRGSATLFCKRTASAPKEVKEDLAWKALAWLQQQHVSYNADQHEHQQVASPSWPAASLSFSCSSDCLGTSSTCFILDHLFVSAMCHQHACRLAAGAVAPLLLLLLLPVIHACAGHMQLRGNIPDNKQSAGTC
jgi:hypothetical protein